MCGIAHAKTESLGPRKDRPVLLTVLHYRERRRRTVCVFLKPLGPIAILRSSVARCVGLPTRDTVARLVLLLAPRRRVWERI